MTCSLLDRARARSMPLAGCALAALSLSLSACPASLQNPEDFADRSEFPSADLDGGLDGAASAGNPNESGTPDCVLAIFKASTGSCAGTVCHDQGANSSGGLDLASPNVATRLVDQPALHKDVGPSDVCPSGDKLIDTSNRSASWLLKKLSASTVGTCGERMPETGNLSSIQLSCLENWVNQVQPGAT
jgi:predicted CxxxxCH...CXXCH cytochrome family protein